MCKRNVQMAWFCQTNVIKVTSGQKQAKLQKLQICWNQNEDTAATGWHLHFHTGQRNIFRIFICSNSPRLIWPVYEPDIRLRVTHANFPYAIRLIISRTLTAVMLRLSEKAALYITTPHTLRTIHSVRLHLADSWGLLKRYTTQSLCFHPPAFEFWTVHSNKPLARRRGAVSARN
jgi:hypothetical protein